MQALVYNGPRNVSIKNVPDAKIERPSDVLVKIPLVTPLTTSTFLEGTNQGTI